MDLLGETPTRAAQSRENNSKSSVNVWPRTARLFSLVRVSIVAFLFTSLAIHFFSFDVRDFECARQTPRIGEIALLYNTTYFREIYLSFLSFFLPSFCALLFYTCTYIFFYHPICMYKCATPRLFCRNPDVFSPSLTLPRIWLVSFSFFFSRQDKQEKKKSK